MRPWVEGEAFVFDDSMEHEAINRSDRERVVLLFDIWRPELTEAEWHWVRTLLHAVDSFSD
ncbi:aspartyl/asparaginyl beta-hydroxylase domain-containing protein [Pseudohaliea sp.]|uniref:aspartyl/asparaginyl beta-hydroxylase domain-containing protein n=1 Tax=Pseudohaliea sp. TaxID=2740289 RepID=UPI0032F019FB